MDKKTVCDKCSHKHIWGQPCHVLMPVAPLLDLDSSEEVGTTNHDIGTAAATSVAASAAVASAASIVAPTTKDNYRSVEHQLTPHPPASHPPYIYTEQDSAYSEESDVDTPSELDEEEVRDAHIAIASRYGHHHCHLFHDHHGRC